MTNFDVYLADAKTVAIAGHVRPDGDCAGSCLATYNYIKNYFPHVKVDLYLEPIPNIFKFMKRSEEILSEWPDDRKYDLFIAQDCGDAVWIVQLWIVWVMHCRIFRRQNVLSAWIIM